MNIKMDVQTGLENFLVKKLRDRYILGYIYLHNNFINNAANNLRCKGGTSVHEGLCKSVKVLCTVLIVLSNKAIMEKIYIL